MLGPGSACDDTWSSAPHGHRTSRGTVDAVVELVIEAMIDAVLVVDADGRVTHANTGAARLTGYTRDELRGLAIGKLLVDDTSGLRTVVRRRIEDGQVLRREESWIVAKDGTRVPVSVAGSPVLDQNGELQGIVLVAHDVRELRAMLDETRAMLLLAERRATLGTLAGGFGHELRNIAQVQIAAVDELQSAVAAGEDVSALVRKILPDLERVGDHMTLHGNKLMQLARPGPDHVAPIDLHAIVRDVVAMLRLAGKLGRVEVVLELSDQPVKLTVNRIRIEQILVNLLTNAVDAIGGAAGTITIAVRTNDDDAICTIHDTGPGIPHDLQARIFEPFFTTKGDHGTGLGLPVVRDIITSYGGTISVASTPGRGTTFTFTLPRS